MGMKEDSVPIPQPPPSLFRGNLGDIDPSNMPESSWALAETYGEIFKLQIAGRSIVMCNSYETVNDTFDWDRFEKPIMGVFVELRSLLGDGLFTSRSDEKAWGVAHRILMPVFGPMGIRKMWDGMMDIISQLVLRWDRLGPQNEILCSDDFTRLAFDVIGLCAFGYRFNNFYREGTHPFVNQMTDVLVESGKRSNRLSLENKLRIFSAQKNQANVKAMHDLCDEILEERIKNPQPNSTDLLNTLLYSKDPQTGETMSRENVRFNMCTFLVAGHETTGGTLGFLFYHLLKNPEKYMKAMQEVDEVVGEGPFTVDHLPKLVYVKYAIYEALRFMGPIALNHKHALKPTLIAGKYYVEPSDLIMLNLKSFMHDPKVWGPDANEYRPERFLNGGYENLPPNAFKAFGDGPRACIGRAFAEQEMIMAVTVILQNFQVEMADASYNLWVQPTLTIKPGDFRIKVRRRPGRNPASSLGAQCAPIIHEDKGKTSKDNAPVIYEAKPLTVLYGSNSGTCKSYAEEIQSDSPRYGFKATIGTLDSATENIPRDQPVVLIAPSYEGKPADNAKKFCQWLENAATSEQLKDVSYAVFGAGNSDWAQTFHRVPKLIDENFEKLGAVRFSNTGFVDVKYDVVGPWETWKDAMFRDIRKASGTTTAISGEEIQVEVTAPKFVSHLGGSQIGYGVVKVNKDLGGGEVGLSKKHMEVELPPGSTYRSGDYFVVLPFNNIGTVKRILRRFNLSAADEIIVKGTRKAFLSTDTPISVFDLLMTRAELGTPASQKQIQIIADHAPEETRHKLSALMQNDTFEREVAGKRMTVLDILEDNLDAALPFAKYLNMLKPLTPRQYSVSSSPLANSAVVQSADGTPTQKLTLSITYDIHEKPSLSGHGEFCGTASTFLARQEPGEKLRCFIRPTNVNFHLPMDPSLPIIMICAGSGLAPMRGFIQERAVIKANRNTALGPALLYFGCRDHQRDFIYSDELKKWEKDGIISLRPCFSQCGPDGAGKGPKYVPDRIWEEREELSKLFSGGAKIFVCGSAKKLGKSAADVCKKIWLEQHKDKGVGEKEAEEWLESVKEDRYVSDTFE
ncbi:cytochrome P450 [Periconia macrospinosa]|uniref:Bifunctional cytochrome P450/NADPH--P450 reductase n=1 Tax=Periconia macrospinosa TaxID=97972 RepID=A0A2V1EA76_9PLEO|nr:cytochrome P450 [Periconia macrospinosa]